MKKDWDYIASVEKAIVEKYGKLSSQDFRCEWQPDKEKEYLEQLQDSRQKREKREAKHETYQSGEILITKRINKVKIERSCPVCKTYSFSRRDDLYMNRFQCCARCYVFFVEHREERWNDGWRPDEELVKNSLRRKN